ncbi:hypothetical protein IJI00_00595 [Candidatus Saccharibacteria bacterium]|nr:hypothetical protein [Candidatus Saccharibacteria bacterium]
MLSLTNGSVAAAFLAFVLGELTDALDGTCAAKWPFPKNKTPKYRKYAAKYDMVIDTALALSMGLFFTLRVTLVGGLTMAIGYTAIATVVDLVVYGKLFGHPDDARPGSLALRNFPLAKKIILARRRLYLSLIFIAAVWTLYASEWPLAVKHIIMALGCAGSLFFWFFLAQRRHNISRDAVAIEKKLEKK